jgi:hypothetical protein
MTNTNQEMVAEVSRTATQEIVNPAMPDEGKRLYQGRMLDELPGAAFAAMTLVWIFSSFGKLIW